MTAGTRSLSARVARAAASARPQRVGVVSSVVGLSAEVIGVAGAIGEIVTIGENPAIEAEIVATHRGHVTCMPLGRTNGLAIGSPVRSRGAGARVPTGTALLGRVIDARGRPIDGRGPLRAERWVGIDNETPPAMDRARITVPIHLGVRALDTLNAVGRGQRLGLFAGSGIGKSSLLSMIARGTSAEVTVIALVGERGREVREFLDDDLGPLGRERSVVVVSTSDEPPMMRLRAAFAATRIAESFRERGQHVVLMMDSVTRVAMAQREIGLSVGEPPATRGYPPSTFSLLARLLERAGTDATGSVTGIYTVLVDGDDHNEPIADATRSILDGHIVLDRALATSGHFPAIDVLSSISRVASRILPPERIAAAAALRAAMAAQRRLQDLIDVGAYQRGTHPLVDAALDNESAIAAFLRQGMDESSDPDEAWRQLDSLAHALGRVA